MNRCAASPFSMLRSLWQQRSLLTQITRRDIASRYRGSALGMLWTFVTPLLMLAVYTFVFGIVFKARFGTAVDTVNEPSTAGFAMTLFTGLMIHALVSECLNRSPTVILQHASYVKKVVFPLEILPVMVAGSALFHFVMSALVLLCGLILAHGSLPVTALLFPLVILPLIPLLLGINWILAALGVYLRDISQLSNLLSMLLMFLSPIFYPIEALPEQFRHFMYLNPLTHIIESVRAVLIFGHIPDAALLLAYSGGGMIVAAFGFWWFQKTRKGFADIM
jgi:lipopolysaccharide transport system permease protein